MYDVISVGSSTVDAFVHTDRSELIKILNGKDEEDLLAYPSGSKILITELDFLVGGGGTNTSVALSRLGFKVAFLGMVGKDENGKRILKCLKDEKVKFIGKIKAVGGYSIILDSIEHDRTILTFKGCNDDFNFEETAKGNLKSKWFYFSSMVGKSYIALEKLSNFAAKKKIKICFNPSSYIAEKGIPYLKKVLDNTNILVLNKEEAESLLGKNDAKNLAIELKEYVRDLAVVTDGKNGAYASDGDYYYVIKANNIKVVESTGAGDAFASTLLGCIMKGKDIETSLKLATTNAESVLQYKGAKNILLNFNQLISELRKRPVEIFKKKI